MAFQGTANEAPEDQIESGKKQEWQRPVWWKIDAGETQANFNTTPDGSNFS